MTARNLFIVIMTAGTVGLAGCATKETATLNVQTMSASDASAQRDGVSVAVASFEDARPEKSRLGVRHHLWGGETTFTVPGGKPGDLVARVMADYLKQKGWRAQTVSVGSSDADVLISGKLLDFSVDADSGVGRTEITAKTKLVIEATNKADGSIVRMTLNGDGVEKVFWFEPEDAQQLVSEVLAESLDKLVQNTKVEEKKGAKVVRLK